jgi:uncharacterized protein YndB with AHSA1/START domain
LLDAPPERVHRAWSVPEELASWFPREVEGSLLVGATTTLAWSDRALAVEVLESDPPRLFRWRWARDPSDPTLTEVTVRIDRHGYGSRLSLSEGPFDLRSEAGAQSFAAAATGWGEALANLRARIDFGVDLRRPIS